MYEAFISTQVPVGSRVDDESMFIAGPGPIEGVQVVHYEGIGDGSSFGVLDVVASGIHRDITVANPCVKRWTYGYFREVMFTEARNLWYSAWGRSDGNRRLGVR